MAEITEAITQDQIAESLMTDRGESTDAEQQTGVEESEASPELEAAESEPTEEAADDWLPTEQEKVFPEEVITKYAQQRYPKILEMLEKDPNNGELRQLLHDKLNTDIFLRTQQRPEVEEEEVETPRTEPTQPQVTTEQWLENVERIADQITDPAIAQRFAGQFLQAFGVKEAPSPEMAKAFTKTMTSFGLNFLNTVLPQMLNSPMAEGKTFFQQQMDKNFEGFTDDHGQRTYDRAWQKASAEIPELAGKSLREIGPKLAEAAERYAGSQEDFDNMVFKGKDGQPLSTYQNAVKKYAVLGKLIAGQKLTSAEAKTFVEAGKKSAAKARNTREAGNLGSGKSNGQIASKFDSNEDIFAEGLELYHQQHGMI